MPRPWFQHPNFATGVRGYLANQSEWKQRRRLDVEPPRGHVLHVVQWYRRAITTGPWEHHEQHTPWCQRGVDNFITDECKGDSWGLFPEGWRLIDYDRAWHHRSFIVGRLYFANQERRARKWSNLPAAATWQKT